MPFSDYNKFKDLTVDSVSGSPSVDKAQPVIVTDGTASTTGNGDIQIDASNVSSKSDIAVYDQNENLLDFEVENPSAIGSGTINGELVLWVYKGSWVRDGTVQAKLVYGNGPSTAEDDTTGTWNNSSQNSEMIWHMSDSSGTITDSSPNGRDAVSQQVSSFQDNGELGDSIEFDGIDDFADAGWQPSKQSWTVYSIADLDNTNTGNTIIQLVGCRNDSGKGWSLKHDDISGALWDVDGVTRGRTKRIPLTTNTFFHLAGRYDNSLSSNNSSLFVDSVKEDTVTAEMTAADDNVFVGDVQNFPNNWDGNIDSAYVFSEAKPDAWIQSFFDASPKGGQTFFSQSAQQNNASTTDTASVTNYSFSVSSALDKIRLSGLFNVANRAETSLNGSIGSSDESIDVNDASQLPSPPFVASIESGSKREIVEVNSVSGNTLGDVFRGQEDTTAQSFSDGVTIANRWTKGTYDQLRNPKLNTLSISSSRTVDARTIFVDSNSSALTVTLSSDKVFEGSKVTVVDKSGNASNNNITVDTQSNENINGDTSAVINSDFEALTFQSDGTNWFITERMEGGGSI